MGSSDQENARPSLRGVHVLVVDDQEEILAVAFGLLAAAGAEVTLASTAQDAMAALERSRPEVLVLDLLMPDADGCELLARIRHLPSDRGRIPAIALTGHASPADRQRTIQAGFQAHVAKPFEARVLVRTVADLVGTRVPPTPPRPER